MALAVCATLGLSACGGGGGGGSGAVTPAPTPTPVTPTPTPSLPAPEPVPTPPAGCKIQVVADTTVASGKTASASVLSCGATLTSVNWTQTSGPAVQILAGSDPTVAIETTQPGMIGLRADVTLADGSTTSGTASINVGAAPSGSYLTVRADHSVRQDTSTSVRAWPVLNGETLSRITWTQTAGPTVTMDTSDQQVLIFTTPNVTTDTLLKFRATMTTASGKVDYDDVAIGIDHQAATPNGAIFDQTARVHPYRQGAQYSGVLARCAYDVSLYYADNGSNNFCTSGTLPPLQTEVGAGVPSVAQVMGRVLVSHDFLGANFEQFLLTQDTNGDFRRLLMGVSAIVIGSHVRPSFYTPATGAIYLDAGQLWLSARERDVVTEVADYRSSFDDLLNFTTANRQVRNNDYARRSMPLSERGTRSVDELIPELGRLLYHELSHAGDFLAPAKRNLNPALSIWENAVVGLNQSSLPSDELAQRYPLTSAEMRGLGQVEFIGATPTAEQRAYTAADVGRFFSSDVASDDYAYSINGNSNSREDLAMLFEEFMMSYRHNIRYDIAFTNVYVDGADSSNLVVAWGERGRIAEPRIKPRIKLVLQRVAPWIDTAAVDALPAPILMTSGRTWGQNLVLGTNAFSSKSASKVETAAQKGERSRDDVRRRVAGVRLP